MFEWKWSLGNPYYKSPRKINNEKNRDIYDVDNKALNQSLGYDDDLMNITNSIFSRNQSLSSNRRESLDSKISDRDMIAQRGVNPYLQNNYVNDVVARDMFLKPLNTTQDIGTSISET